MEMHKAVEFLVLQFSCTLSSEAKFSARFKIEGEGMQNLLRLFTYRPSVYHFTEFDRAG
jgi:hypothetical protein